jgi:aminoglycoside 3-N-acetyltransferase
MGLIVEKRRVKDELIRALGGSNTPVVGHSDLLRVGILDCNKTKPEMLADYLDIILEISNHIPLLIPSFNYSYFKTGIYYPLLDPCEVGILGETLRTIGRERTLTPIFPFILLNAPAFRQSAPVKNPLGAQSTFAELARQAGRVFFFGADFHSNTFIHHVEETVSIGYRYLKPFPGKVITPDQTFQLDLLYRVRPMRPNSAEYDWERLKIDLLERKILRTSIVGNAKCLEFSARELLDYWQEKLRNDELWLLTPQSRAIALELFKSHGKPLHYDQLECGG